MVVLENEQKSESCAGIKPHWNSRSLQLTWPASSHLSRDNIPQLAAEPYLTDRIMTTNG